MFEFLEKITTMVTITEDGKLKIKGDHISFTNLEEDEGTQETLKRHSKLLLIKCLLEYFVIDPDVHYVDYPDKE